MPLPIELTPVTISYITTDVTSYTVGFSHAVLVDVTQPNGDALTIDGDTVTAVSHIAPNALEIYAAAGYAPDLAWLLIRQPPWLLTPIASPQSGVTT